MPKIELRLASDKDREFLRNIRNKNKQFFFKQNYITKTQHQEWLKQQNATKKCFIFIIFESQKQIKLGTISLVNVDFKKRTAVLGRFILLEKYRYLGFGKLVVKKFEEICRNINIHKIMLYLRSGNKHALRLYLNFNYKIVRETEDKIFMEKNL